MNKEAYQNLVNLFLPGTRQYMPRLRLYFYDKGDIKKTLDFSAMGVTDENKRMLQWTSPLTLKTPPNAVGFLDDLSDQFALQIRPDQTASWTFTIPALEIREVTNGMLSV